MNTGKTADTLQVIGDASNVICHLNDLIHKMAFGGNDELRLLAYKSAVDYFERLDRHFPTEQAASMTDAEIESLAKERYKFQDGPDHSWNAMQNQLRRGFKDGYKAAEQAAEQGRWIAVSERLPPLYEDKPQFSVKVLVTDGEIDKCGELNCDTAYYSFPTDIVHTGYWPSIGFEPTHWQPLPPAPTAPDKEKE